MKKIAFLCYLLCFALLMQCTILPASAQAIPVETESTAGTEETQGETVTTTTTALPFGQSCIQKGCRTLEGMVPLDGSERKLDTASSAFVYETKTKTVIYSYNPDMKVSPGNLAKIVTALLAIELCEQDEVVTINTSNIAKLPSGAVNKNLKNGEQITVKDLLHCLILASASDAAVVLAEHISGNLQGFVVLMNERVKKMGCTSTEFANVHGVDSDSSYTTARDMAKIVTEAMKNEIFQELFSATTYTVPATNKSDERSFATMNYMMDDSIITKYYDNRVTGGMQSYVSPGTGASMVITANSKKITEDTQDTSQILSLVCVVMGCTREFASNGWQVTSYGNLDEMTDLLAYICNNFKISRVLYEGQALNQFPVSGGESQVVGQPNVNYDTVLKADCQMDNLIKEYTVVGGGLSAPISAGDKIGTVALKYRNCCVAEAELFAISGVKTLSSSASIADQGAGSDDGGIFNVIGTVCVVVLGIAGVYLGVNAWRRFQAKARRRRRRAARRRSN